MIIGDPCSASSDNSTEVWNGEGGLCQTSQMEARQQEEGASDFTKIPGG